MREKEATARIQDAAANRASGGLRRGGGGRALGLVLCRRRRLARAVGLQDLVGDEVLGVRLQRENDITPVIS